MNMKQDVIRGIAPTHAYPVLPMAREPRRSPLPNAPSLRNRKCIINNNCRLFGHFVDVKLFYSLLYDPFCGQADSPEKLKQGGTAR